MSQLSFSCDQEQRLTWTKFLCKILLGARCDKSGSRASSHSLQWQNSAGYHFQPFGWSIRESPPRMGMVYGAHPWRRFMVPYSHIVLRGPSPQASWPTGAFLEIGL